jgi:hypothetical protein
VEVSIKNSPTGQRMLTKAYPKDNEPRTMGLPVDLVDQLARAISTRRLGPGDLLFPTREGTPISRNTFRSRVWLPAVRASGVDFDLLSTEDIAAEITRTTASGIRLVLAVPVTTAFAVAVVAARPSRRRRSSIL